MTEIHKLDQEKRGARKMERKEVTVYLQLVTTNLALYFLVPTGFHNVVSVFNQPNVDKVNSWKTN